MQTRRQAVGALIGTAVAQAQRARKRPPNVLVLLSDQHQRGASGAYGHKEVHTPNIDRIVAAGCRFDRAYCQAPVCVPSRGSLITSLYPHRHGAKILQDPLPPGIPTIAHFFKERGYATGAIGKMHFVDESQRHGFDARVHEGDFQQTLPEEDRKRLRQDQGGADGVAGRPSALPERYFQDAFFANKSVEFLQANRDRPFLLFSSVVRPHTPLVPQREYFDLYRDRKLTLPTRSRNELEDGFAGNLVRSKERGWYQQTDAELLNSLRGYYGNISQMDSYVGRVYDALHDLGLHDNTIVVYTTDHGEMAGAHRIWTKHNMYEQSVGVPLAVSFPDRIRPGSSSAALVEHVDLFATLTELAGFASPRQIQGRSFAPLLQGRRYKAREFAYSEYYFCRNVFTRDDRYVGKPPMLMVRTDRWKLNYLSWDRCELYDLFSDPGEFRNLIDDPKAASVAQELKRNATKMFES
jgi:choline-sulfatase